MEHYLQSLPKMFLGSMAVVGVLLLMYFADPPTTVCDIQLEPVKKKLNKDFMQRDPKKFGKYSSSLDKSYQYCLKSNSSGGCYDLFRRMTIFEQQLRKIPRECGDHDGVLAFKGWLSKGTVLMVRIAWGESPPENFYDKKGWLEMDNLALFCRMKREYKRLYGKGAWDKMRDGALIRLPEAKNLTRKDLWQKSIFSFPCKGLI